MGVFGCGLVGVWCWWCVRGCGLVGVGWCVLVGVCVVVVSDAHVSGLFLFSWFCLLFCLVVWLITGCLVVWARVGVCLWGVWVGVGVFLWRGVGWWLVVFVLVCGGWVCFVDG